MSTATIWSWIVTFVGITGFLLAGRKIWWAWYVNIGCQAGWVTYALVSHTYAFLIAAGFYTAVFSNNAYKWTKEHFHGPEIDFNEVAYVPLSEMDPELPVLHIELPKTLSFITYYDPPEKTGE